MSDYQDPTPRNNAERVAAEDSEVSENAKFELEQRVIIYAAQAGGVWLVEPHTDEDDEWSVSFPMFEWDRVVLPQLADSARAYLAELFPEVENPQFELKVFTARRVGKVLVVCVGLPSNLNKSLVRKRADQKWSIRWYNLREAQVIGGAAMSREEEWQQDLLKKVIEQKIHGKT